MQNKSTLLKKIFSFVFAFFALVAFAIALPSGYKSIKLGMGVDEVKSELKKNSEFGYRGDRDVSLSPSDNEVLIETDAAFAPYSFLDRCWFQFSDGKLAIITINMNQEKIDHYSIFKTLCDKYGNPESLTPEKSTWKDSSVIMTLERPLSIKYADAKVVENKKNSSDVQKTVVEQARDEFLSGL